MRSRTTSRFVICAVLAVGCVALSRPIPATDATRRIEVVAKRFSYTPAEITLKKGEPVVLELRSEDVTHGVKFPELNLQIEIRKGAISELYFTPMQVGDFVGHCSRFCGSGHGSMILTLHVTE
jgi:cytochrome c oxidase subunit 2